MNKLIIFSVAMLAIGNIGAVTTDKTEVKDVKVEKDVKSVDKTMDNKDVKGVEKKDVKVESKDVKVDKVHAEKVNC